MSFKKFYLWKQQYICRFNLSYHIEKTYNAPFFLNKFHSTVFEKNYAQQQNYKSSYWKQKH